MKLEIPIISRKQFEQRVIDASRKYANEQGERIIAKDVLKGCPKFDFENIGTFYKRWFLIMDLPDNLAVEINKTMYWIISGDDVIIYNGVT